jgi:hypothetical protein
MENNTNIEENNNIDKNLEIYEEREKSENNDEIMEVKNGDDHYVKKIIEEFRNRPFIKRDKSMPNINKNLINEIDEKDANNESIQIDKNTNINELNNLNEILKINNEQNALANNNNNEVIKEEDEIIKIDDYLSDSKKSNSRTRNKDNKEQKKTLVRSKSFYRDKDLTYNYYEENEDRNGNIKINNTTNEIESISLNLLLYKIIFEDFLKKYADNIYHFCQQCFCFIKTDIFFKKILNCYKFYRKRNSPIEKISNLIDFFNALIIEMFEYYKTIPKEDIVVILNIYNEIILDLIINNKNNANNDSNDKNDNNDDSYSSDKMIYDKNDIINFNLSFDADIQFRIKKTNTNKSKKNKDKQNEQSMFFDSDYVVVEREEENDLFNEKIYNEQKELNECIYSIFRKNLIYKKTPSTNDTNDDQNLDNFSIVTFTENLLTNLKNFFVLFKSKKPNYEDLNKAKNTIIFYKYLKKEEEILKKDTNDENQTKNDINKKNLDTKDYLYSRFGSNNLTQRNYMKKGFFSLFDWKTEEIGDELIRVTTKFLKKIEKKELYRAIYIKNDKNIKSPNVVENINNFNKLTFFIIEDIISYDHASDRAKIIEKWVQIADYCKSKKDYNDCLAINSALNSFIITGLELTNKELKSKTTSLIKSINNFCSCVGNYKFIREEIKNSLDNKEYYYPYLGIMLKDISFFEENFKYLMEGELINFEKIEKIQKIIENNFRFKNVKMSNEEKASHIQELNFFEKLEMNTEENLESIANQIEPKFIINDGKKNFKRQTKMDDKYFSKYKHSLMRKSMSIQIFQFKK